MRLLMIIGVIGWSWMLKDFVGKMIKRGIKPGWDDAFAILGLLVIDYLCLVWAIQG